MSEREAFVRDLLEQVAGLSGRELARRSGYSPTLVNDVIAGRKVPTEDQLRDLLQASGADDETVRRWLSRRLKLTQAIGGKPATGPEPSDQDAANSSSRRRRLAVTAGLLVGGVIVGFAGGFVVGHSSAEGRAADVTGTAARIDHTAGLGVTLYADPSRSGGGISALGEGSRIVVVCQVGDGEPITDRVEGEVITWPVWDRLDTGDYVPDIYTSLPKNYEPGPGRTALMTC